MNNALTSGNVVIPVPTSVHGGMYPATVLLPGNRQLNRCKVFATSAGLYVYVSAPEDQFTPDWWAVIDFGRTKRMPTGYEAKIGWDVHTDKGLVTVTSEGGCGCGWPLKRWVPAYARNRSAWPRNVNTV